VRLAGRRWLTTRIGTTEQSIGETVGIDHVGPGNEFTAEVVRAFAQLAEAVRNPHLVHCSANHPVLDSLRVDPP
jgi:hypothetical protein